MPAKRLERSSQNKMIGGVCAGLANYMNLDPTIVRIGFLVALLVFGLGPLLYIILWVVMPVSATF